MTINNRKILNKQIVKKKKLNENKCYLMTKIFIKEKNGDKDNHK